jgi:Ion channel
MIFLAIPAILLILIVLLDVFEVVVLPRRIARRVRLARFAFRSSWLTWSSVAGNVHDGERRETILSFFGPLFLIMLLVMWAVLLVIAFALLQFALGSSLLSRGGNATFWTDLYASGTTFFTLGLGDVVPDGGAARAVTVLEAGIGFGFLALVIGYLPTFYQTFSRREVIIALLDARAGSPPTAGALLRRYGGDDSGHLRTFLADFERWSAELLESHLSYPVVGAFRSQHERQSWVAALCAILDFSAFLVVSGKSAESEAAELTFAIARHAAVDLAQVYQRRPELPDTERLTRPEFDALISMLGYPVADRAKLDRAYDGLASLRATYEPFVAAMAEYLLMPLPTWLPQAGAVADWESSPTETGASGIADPIGSKLPRR